MTPPRLSVILCTYNPRRAYLERTLAALAAQTLPRPAWRLVVVDNNSSPAVATWIDLRGFGDAVVVTEPVQGFTPALLRGLREVRSETCVLLHDDNVLPPDYLAEVERLAGEWPRLGAWGGGYEPEYETEPDPQLAPFLAYLAVNPVVRDRWSNAPSDYGATPTGAGMAVRTNVLRRYAELVSTDARRASLGRHTDRLTSCEDFDIAFTAIDLGYGTGVFSCLKVRHLIPKERVQRPYLHRLVEGHAYSTVLLQSFRGAVSTPPRGIVARLRRWRWRRGLPPVERELQDALARGAARGFAALAGQRGRT